METNSLKSSLPLLRRFLAICLTVLSVMFLFWPSMIAMNSETKSEYIEDTIETYRENYEYSKSDARAYANAQWLGAITSQRISFSFLQVRNGLSAVATENSIRDKYAKKEWEENYREWKNSHDGDPYYTYNYDDDRVYVSSYKEYVKATRTPNEKKFRSFIGTNAVLVNILFFALLAAGAAAIVLYAMGQTRIAGIVFAALTVAADIVFIIMLSFIKKNEDMIGDYSYLTAPGASMFLLPIFAIAACILYQPSKKAKRRAPRRAPRPAADPDNLFTDATGYVPPVRTNENPFTESAGYVPPIKASGNPFETAPRPAPRPMQKPTGNPFESAPSAPRSAAAGWTCPKCNTMNRNEARFCIGCGSQKPAPAETAPVCRNCGNTLKSGVKYCPYCGEQQ